jgi:hypothetical protein
MKPKYTVRYLDSRPAVTLGDVLKKYARSAQPLSLGDYIEIAQNLDLKIARAYPVAHWKLRVSVEIIPRTFGFKKSRPEVKRYLIELYFEPMTGVLLVRWMELAPTMLMSFWSFLHKDARPGQALDLHESEITDGRALRAALDQVKQESEERLARMAALPLQEPLPPVQPLETPLRLV